jgi:hypothetical protein
MKISYDKVGPGHLYPLSKADVERISDAIPAEVVNVIREIRLAYNRKTTQEGKVVKRGRLYDIRVNFCLTDVGGCLQSRMLSDKKRYIDEMRRYGGKPDPSAGVVHWDLEHARRYACYVLLHEIGHVVYLERYAHGRPVGKAHSKEETWCDAFSAALVRSLSV